MAAIDYTIPNQFKGIQLESPINQMMAAAQLQSAQNQNALAKYQLGAAQRAEEKEVNRMRLLEQAGGDESAVANALLKAGDVAGYSAYVKAAEDRKTQKLTQEKTAGDIFTTRLAQSKSLLDNIDPTDPNAGAAFIAWHEANHADPYLGPRLAAMGVTAEQSRARINAAIQQGPAAIAAMIDQSRLGIDKFKEKQKVERDKEYADFYMQAVERGEDNIPTQEQYFARKQQPAMSPQNAPVVAAPAAAGESPAAGTATAPAAELPVSPEGEKILPKVDVSSGGFVGISPDAARLYALGDPRATKLADQIQAAYVAKGKAGELTGEYQNVANAERIIDELSKNPTPLNKQIIASLREQIKASQKGKGVHVTVPVSMSTEKKYGEQFAGNVAKADIDLRDAAEKAPEAAATSNRVLQILSTGNVFTGTGANVKLQLAKLLRLGGATDSEAIANTEVLISSLANTTLEAIASSKLGSAQGFTNTDRDFLEKAKAGQITYDAKSLRDLAVLAHKAAVATAGKWNKRSKQIPKSATEGTGIDISDIEVPPMFGSKPTGGSKPAGKMDKTPATNNKGWKLHIDKDGNRAYVSPDGKQFEEVK